LTLKTGYFDDPNPATQVQTLPLEGPRSLGKVKKPAEVQTTQMSYDGTGFQAMNVPLKRGEGYKVGPGKPAILMGAERTT